MVFICHIFSHVSIAGHLGCIHGLAMMKQLSVEVAHCVARDNPGGSDGS